MLAVFKMHTSLTHSLPCLPLHHSEKQPIVKVPNLKPLQLVLPFVWAHEWMDFYPNAPCWNITGLDSERVTVESFFHGDNVHKNPPPPPPQTKWAILITFVFMFVTYKKAIYAHPPHPPSSSQNTLLHVVSVNIRSESFAHLGIFILNAVWDIPHSFDAYSGLPLTTGFYVTGKLIL